jgi:hypothetical protein
MYYLRARVYSPLLGRFLERDPKGYAEETNLYIYGGNNPLTFSDPMGTGKTDSIPQPDSSSPLPGERPALNLGTNPSGAPPASPSSSPAVSGPNALDVVAKLVKGAQGGITLLSDYLVNEAPFLSKSGLAVTAKVLTTVSGGLDIASGWKSKDVYDKFASYAAGGLKIFGALTTSPFGGAISGVGTTTGATNAIRKDIYNNNLASPKFLSDLFNLIGGSSSAVAGVAKGLSKLGIEWFAADTVETLVTASAGFGIASVVTFLAPPIIQSASAELPPDFPHGLENLLNWAALQ